MNIVLIGYRGTGKSSVSSILAERLGWPRISSDEQAERELGCPIADYVESHNWAAFRDMEERIVESMTQRDAAILDMGGGVIERDGNVARMKATGTVVWLRASVDTIAARIGGDRTRPSLTGTKTFIEEIGEVLANRSPKYAAAAAIVVDTEAKTPAEIADEILAQLPQTGRSA